MVTGLPAYLLGVGIAALWTALDRRSRLRTLLLLWAAGLVLARILPGVLRSGASRWPLASEIAGWAGAVILLRALLGLTLRERPVRRRTWIAAAGFVLALLPSRHFTPGFPVTSLLAIPWLNSLRWCLGLGGGSLALLAAGALVSVVLGTTSFENSLAAASTSIPGFAGYVHVVTTLSVLYALLSFPRLAWRVQFSIRRISRRLVVSHLLAGLVPGILAIAFLLLAGALYLSTYRGMVVLRTLQEASQNAERRLAADLDAGRTPASPFASDAPGQVVFVREEGSPPRVIGEGAACDPESLLAQRVSARDALLLWDGRHIFLRARAEAMHDGRRVTAEALAPVDSLRMAALSTTLGEPVRLNPTMRVTRTSSSISLGEAGDTAGVSIGPRSPGRLHLPGGAIVSCLVADPVRWHVKLFPIASSASPGEMLGSLFSSAHENPISAVVLSVLAFIAFLILAAIWMTAGMVVGMARSISKAVSVLTEATQALREGRLDHRIRLEGQDELWSVAGSFNEMTEGLERMREVELERERLEQELLLARSIQTRLLPAGPPETPGLDVAGVSKPARHVGGDYFDYIPLAGGSLAVIVADVSGKGVPAALLMSSLRASLRSEDVGALGPAKTLSRLNRFICASVDPGKFVTAFLVILDPAAGRLRYACAGHDPPILMATDGTMRDLPEGGLVLGLLPDSPYEEASVAFDTGATLVIYTDGVTEAQDPSEEFFGRERLVATLLGGRADCSPRLLERIVAEVQSFAATAPQYDDITLVLARRL